MEEHFMCNIFFLNVIIFFKSDLWDILLFVFKGLIAQNLSQRENFIRIFFKSLFQLLVVTSKKHHIN